MSRRRPARPSGFVPFLPAEVEQSVASRFEAQVARQGDRLALTDRHGRHSYAELNRQANQIAHAVLDRRGPAEVCVATLGEPGAPPGVVALGLW